MRFPVSLILIFCALFFASCRSSVEQQMPDEEAMARMLQENPDSLAYLLEEKIDPLLLSDSLKADYGRWLTNTHSWQGRSLMNDTLIHFSLDYYKKTDSEHLLEAYMLAARQIDWDGTHVSQREQIMKEALHVAQAKSDTATILNIAAGLSYLYKAPEDEEKINELININKKYAGEQWSVFVYYINKNLYTLLGQNDSVLFYVSKGAELAREQNNRYEIELTREYARRLSFSRQGENALKILKEFENRMPALGTQIMYDYIITWINLGKLDSAQVYIDAMHSIISEYKNRGNYTHNIEIDIVDLTMNVFQSIIDTKKGELLLFEDIGKAIDNIHNTSKDKAKNDRELQLVHSKLVVDNLNLEIERTNLRQRFLWAGIGVLFVIALIVFFYQRKLLRKERSVQQIKEQLRLHSLQLSENELLISKNEEIINDLSLQIDEGGELKQEINQLTGENETLRQKNISLQNDIEQYSKSIGKKNREMAVYDKLVEQKARLQEREQFLTAKLIASTPLLDRLSKKPRYIDIMEWPEIVHAVNQLHDGFTYRLGIDFPSLTEEDIQYCCLIKLRLSTSVISTLTAVSPSSVTKRKQRIKEKMNQQRPADVRKEQPLEIYMWSYSTERSTTNVYQGNYS